MLEVFDTSPKDGSEINKQVVPITFALLLVDTGEKYVGFEQYTVTAGDTLRKIAQRVYGDANKYQRLFEANRGQITDPNLIRPGQVLRVPLGEHA